MTEDGSGCKCRFKSLEGVLLGFSLFELLILIGEEGKGLDNMGEIFDEPAVIVSKPNKPSYVAEFLGDRPFHNGVYLFEVHL